MAMTVQVVYPVGEGKTFDYDYYFSTHKDLVDTHFGANGMTEGFASRGVAGGPDTPSPFFAIFTARFPDEATMNAALAAAGPVMADLPNFTNVAPQMMIGVEGG